MRITICLLMAFLIEIVTLHAQKKVFNLVSPEKTNIAFANRLTQNKERNIFKNSYYYNGGGVAIGDLNNDGLADIFFTGNMVPNRVYLNKGNLNFVDITEKALGPQNNDWCTGVTMVDINNDGFLDIYICRSADNKNPLFNQNMLLINNKDLTFTEQALNYNLNDSLFSTQAAFFDYDLDGDLDAYIMNVPNHSYLEQRNTTIIVDVQDAPAKSDHFYENIDGKFIESSKQKGIQNNAFGLGLSIGDIDNNGYPDIYVSNDFEERDYLYVNTTNSFEDKTLDLLKHICNFGMGTDIADFNNDGHMDIIQMDMSYTSHVRSKTNMPSMFPLVFWDRVKKGRHHQYMRNTLQLNNGNATFSDISHLAGVAKTDWSWGSLMADLDNDGYKDIIVTNGYHSDVRNRDSRLKLNDLLEDGAPVDFERQIRSMIDIAPKNKEHNFLFRNNGDLTFEDKSIDWGFDLVVNSNGVAYGDLDNDGDLDLVVNNLDAPASVYENTLGNQNNYLAIQLEGTAKNKFAIGAKVTIYTSAGKQVQELFPTRGFQSSVDYKLHFGLGKTQKVDRVEIRWPDLKTTVLKNVKGNKILKVVYDKANFSSPIKIPENQTILTNVSKEFFPEYTQKENDFSDFDEQVLLPHMLSRQGPCLAVADIDQDGLEDVFVGGAKQQLPSLFLQQRRGEMVNAFTHDFDDSKNQEDLGALFLDVDGDGDQDLYVCSGGSEYIEGEHLLQDRLYLNNYGSLTLTTTNLPKMLTSTQVVKAADFDADGDLDLFVGGRLVPGKYPQTPRSYLLENDGKGNYKDVTEQYSADLMRPGMVTGASFGDVDGDGRLDLTLLGEWMPLQVFLNKGTSFEKMPLQQETEGLWFSLQEVDIDGDGDLDFVGGNIGKNCKFKGSLEKPFNIYGDDFDNNGTWDMMMSSYEGDKNYPVRGRDCSSEQMPTLLDSFPSFQAFAVAEITDICGPKIEEAFHLTARTFYTSFFINDGEGHFTMKKLPSEAQFSPIKDIHVEDLNKDGHLDLILVGNMYDTEVETVRYDAGRGLVMLGEGKGKFKPLSPLESGLFAWDNVKQIRKLTVGKRELYVLAVNQGKLMTFEKQPAPKK